MERKGNILCEIELNKKEKKIIGILVGFVE